MYVIDLSVLFFTLLKILACLDDIPPFDEQDLFALHIPTGVTSFTITGSHRSYRLFHIDEKYSSSIVLQRLHPTPSIQPAHS